MDTYTGKRFCILGDSISTYEGYTPASSVFYDSWVQKQAGISSVNDTWWMQVINSLGGILGTNNSYAGSTVYGTRPTAGCSDHRISALDRNGIPDVILVNMGGNDWGFSVSRKGFSKAYRQMLSKLSALYPSAEIWCATLLRGRQVSPELPAFFNAEAAHPISTYNNLIGTAVASAGCHIASLGDDTYDAMDGVHPNRDGMTLIAQQWLRALKDDPS